VTLTVSEAVGYTPGRREPQGSLVISNLDQVRDALLYLIALILSIAVHEFGHAWVATRLGDPLPRAQGRLTLLPMRHIDPIGTVVFPLLMYFFHIPLLGWGRPVETNPSNYTRRISRGAGEAMVAVAGPIMNLLMATAVTLVVIALGRLGLIQRPVAVTLLQHLVHLNLTLMFFNLLPIPPLDGGAVLAWVLPRSMQGLIDFLSRWGFLILLGLTMVTPVLGLLLTPVQVLWNFWGLAALEAAGL
jgi:Zn-dependent protease